MRIQNTLAMQSALPKPVKIEQGLLDRGNVISGEVVESKGGQAVLRLDGGGILRATVVSDVPLQEGEHVVLQVADYRDGQATLRLLPDVDAVGQALSRLLEHAGLPSDERTRMLANLMIERGMDLQPDVLRAAAKILAENPLLNPRVALFLAENGLEGTPEQMVALARMVSGETVDAQLVSLINDVLSLAAEEVDAPEAVAAAVVEGEAADGDEAAVETKVQTQAKWVDSANAADGKADVPRIVAPPSPEVSAAMTRIMRAHFPEAAQALPTGEWSGAMAIAVREASLMPAESVQGYLQGFVDSLPVWLDPAQKEVVTDMLRTIADAMRPTDGLFGAAAQGDDRLKMVANELIRLFGDEAAIKDAAEGLKPGLIAARRELVAMGLGERSPLVEQTQQALDQARLADSFSRFMYLQIPLNQNGNARTAELYVMKRGGGKKNIDPEHATMLIALNTEHMGRVESMIQVEGRSVALRFRVGSEALRDHFRANALSLNERFLERGYRLGDVRCTLLEEPVTPLTVEEELGKAFGWRDGNVFLYI